MDNYLMIGEVAKLIGVSLQTVRKLDRKGILEAQRLERNNFRVFKREDVESYIALRNKLKGVQ